MKVLHLANAYPSLSPAWGGAEVVLERYLDLLMRRTSGEHRLALASVVPETELPPWMVRVTTSADHLGPWLGEYHRRLKVRFLPVDPFATRSFARQLDSFIPDLVHIHNFNLAGAGPIREAARRGIPVVLSIYDYWSFCPKTTLIRGDNSICRSFHGPECPACTGRKFLAPVQDHLYGGRRKRFDRFLSLVSRFLVLSEASRNLLVRYGIDGERIRLVRQIYPSSLVTTRRSRPGGKRILFVGWIQFSKGLHIVLDALPKVLAVHPKAVLDVLNNDAEPSYEQRISETIRSKGLEDRVRFHGKLPRDEAMALFDSASCIVLPEQWLNMSPVVLIEGMARSVPIVASRIGGIPEFIRDGVDGLLAAHDDPDDWAEKIISVLSDPGAAEIRVQSASKRLLEITGEDSVLSSLTGLYGEVGS